MGRLVSSPANIRITSDRSANLLHCGFNYDRKSFKILTQGKKMEMSIWHYAITSTIILSTDISSVFEMPVYEMTVYEIPVN
jgi:hypothetical protein